MKSRAGRAARTAKTMRRAGSGRLKGENENRRVSMEDAYDLPPWTCLQIISTGDAGAICYCPAYRLGLNSICSSRPARESAIVTTMKIFVVHYKKLVERKALIVSQLRACGLDAEFVEQYERGNLREEDLAIFDRRKKYGFFGPSMPKVQMAITLSHLYAYRQIASGHPFGLVLEDDARFDEKLGVNIAECMGQLPDKWDMLLSETAASCISRIRRPSRAGRYT